MTQFVSKTERLNPMAPPDELLDLGGALDVAIFNSTPWLETWLRSAPADLNALCFSFKAGDDKLACVVGLEPGRHPPVIGLRRAWFNESGNAEFDSIYPEYNRFFAARPASPEMTFAALEELLEKLEHIDELIVRNAEPQMTHAAQLLCERSDLEFRPFLTQPTFQIDLNNLRRDGTDYVSSRGKSMRAKTRRTIRRYENEGAITMERARTPEQREKAFADLIDLHTNAWQERGQSGVFGNPRLVNFHRNFLKYHPEYVDLLTVRAGSVVVGVLHNFITGSIAANYQCGFVFDPNDKQLSPGYLCHALAADHYMELGFSTYDLLGGGARYKSRLADEGVTLTSFSLVRPTWRSRLVSGLKRLRGGAVSEAETRQT